MYLYVYIYNNEIIDLTTGKQNQKRNKHLPA